MTIAASWRRADHGDTHLATCRQWLTERAVGRVLKHFGAKRKPEKRENQPVIWMNKEE
jgi:hypothetical protein